MAFYKWDKQQETWVKFSDRSPPKASGEGMSFSAKIMEGYRKTEAKGGRIYGSAAKIKKIWNN